MDFKKKAITVAAFLACFNASVLAQNVKMHLNGVTVKTAMHTLKQQSGYSFVFEASAMNTNKKISVNATTLNEAVKQILSGQNVSYTISGKNIIVSPTTNKHSVQKITRKSKKITGRVLDEQGEPVMGAVVKEAGAKSGAITDIDGNFTLDAHDGETVEVSYIGYQPQTVKVGPKDAYDIQMRPSSKTLNEVVVTALGIKKEAKSLSYNVQQVNGSEVLKVADANFVNNLNGKIAGVTINSSSSGIGGSSRVVMRGAKSINGNNNVLYVIDGIPMPSLQATQPSGIFEGAGQSGDAAAMINPDDIESLSVLSGPSAAALYGSDAANGVILITTKKGKEGKVQVNYSGNFQFSSPFVMPEFQNEYGPSETGSYYSWGAKLNKRSSYDPKNFFQTSTSYTNSVNLTTGTEHNQTFVSLSSTNSEGIIHNNNYDKYNLSIRNTSKFLNDKMTLDVNYMLSSVKEQNMVSQGLYFNPLVAVYLFPAGDDFDNVGYYERYDSDRNFPVQYWSYGDNGLSMQNPYWITERTRHINHKTRNMATMSLKYDATKWLSLTGRVKYDNSDERYEKKYNASTNTLFASKYGHYALNSQNNRQLFAEAFATVNKYFDQDRWSLTAVLGTNFDQRDYRQNGFDGNLKGVANLFTLPNVATADAGTKFTQAGYTTRKEALYGSAQLGYKSRVYLDMTARNDWASKLAGAQDSYFYWSAGLSGIITDIIPQIKNDYLNYFKARISYSEVGNDPYEPFLTHPTYAMGTTYPVTSTRMPNTDLKPERTKSWEAGLDFVLFKNRLKLNATLYSSQTYNQFFTVELPSSSGYTSVIVNGGRVDNKGIELSARYTQKLGQVNWESYLTWTLNRNKIKELLREWKNPEDGQVYSLSELDMGGSGAYKMRLTEGGTLGDIYVNTLATDEHGAIYVDPVSQEVRAESNKYVKAGHSTPNYNLSWGNSFSWKGLTGSFLFTYRNGGIVVSETQAMLNAFGASKESADARNAGGVIINGKPIPAQKYYQTVGSTSGNIGSQYVYSATNLRLSEVTIGYDLPVNRWVSWLRGANISFVAHNLWMLKNNAPNDPESTASTGTYWQGIDYFMQPSLRTMGFSVKLQF